MADRFLIAPYSSNSGWQTDVRPWLIPEQAFARLNNAYVFRGRVRKRFGSTWTTDSGTQINSRLRVLVGTTDPGTGNLAGFVPGVDYNVGQMFSIGTELYTVYIQTAGAQPMLDTGATPTATFNTANGAFNFVGAPKNIAVYWYPALPVMGLLTFENGQEIQEPTYAFDTEFAYTYNSTSSGWDRLAGEASAGAAIWGTVSTTANSNFFWGTTWTGSNAFQPLFFVTNFDNLDPRCMRYYDPVAAQWNVFMPSIDGGTNFLTNARIIIAYRNRLVAFNTWEGTAYNTANNYVNRARYSQVGDPTAADAWNQAMPGKGSAIDAPTTEEIITVEFVKDRLIVFFERSTYELAYTGNQAYPFVWNKLNTELGAESTNSIIPFDNVCIGIGNTGIHQCNGSQVSRIDNKIPNEVFEIHDSDQGVERVCGIRDYFVEMVYWTFPSTDASATFPYPNQVLVYNYQTETWSINDDSFTVFGYWFAPPKGAVTWDSTQVTWDSDVTWDGGNIQAQFRQVLAGNQEGYIVQIKADQPTNAPALQITNLTYSGDTVTVTAIDHNLRSGDYVLFQNIVDNGNIGTLLNNTIYYVNADVANSTTFTITLRGTVALTGTYQGGGTLARVSQIDILTKEYNFYEKQGRNSYISKVDFMVDKTDVGQIQVDYYVSTSIDPLTEDSLPNPIGTGAILGTGILETFPYPTVPFEANTTRVIHPVYFQADGEFIQFQLILSDPIMTSTTYDPVAMSLTGPALEDFQMHFMVIYAQPASSRFQ